MNHLEVRCVLRGGPPSMGTGQPYPSHGPGPIPDWTGFDLRSSPTTRPTPEPRPTPNRGTCLVLDPAPSPSPGTASRLSATPTAGPPPFPRHTLESRLRPQGLGPAPQIGAGGGLGCLFDWARRFPAPRPLGRGLGAVPQSGGGAGVWAWAPPWQQSAATTLRPTPALVGPCGGTPSLGCTSAAVAWQVWGWADGSVRCGWGGARSVSRDGDDGLHMACGV